jgi:PAT family beta-lactamase induction signal transducer AmpG
MDRQKAYVIFGILQAGSAVLMAYTPHTEPLYIIWTCIYAFALGLCFAAFNAFVLEAIGKGAAGTKFTVYAAISNVPIYYMTLVDGWGHTHFGARGMLNIEAAFAVLGAVLFLGLLKYAKAGGEMKPVESYVAQ